MRKRAHPLPPWCKTVKKVMIDRDMNVTELAELVGMNRSYISGVVNGRVVAPEIAERINKVLDISERTPNVI